MKRKIVFENGRVFIGEAFGSKKELVAEIVFNTNMVGYQEMLSDPAYTDLAVVMTYPLIGNVGIINDDFDSKIIGISALITKEYNDKPSNFRYANTLSETLEEAGVPGVTHVDTRAITKMISKFGTMKAAICGADTSNAEALRRIKNHTSSKDQVKRVSCKKIWYSRCSNPKYNVVAIDTGITYSNLRDLNKNGINVTVVPYDTDYEKIKSLRPDGIFLSKGPGNPKNLKKLIELTKRLQGKYPIYGMSLGCQILALANNMDIVKMKVGHRGSNHSVRDIKTDSISIVSQNHGYVIKDDAPKDIEITHRNVLDNTIEGIEIVPDKAFAVQYYPNSHVNPKDSNKIISKFIKYMDMNRGEK